MSETATARFLGALWTLTGSQNLLDDVQVALTEFRRDREVGGPLSSGEWRGVLLSARDLLRESRDRAPDFVDAADQILTTEITRRSADREERIREKAHRLWIDEGRLEGRDDVHWRRAEALVAHEDEQDKAAQAATRETAERGRWWQKR